MNEIPVAGETFRGEDGTVSTILPANYGQDYEASEGELEEYAEYIGIDPVKEPTLMWIAKEGLRAPLPDGWRACQTDDNEVYYFNFQTGESLWDHPMDEHYKAKVVAERAAAARGGSGGSGSGGAVVAPAARTGSTKAIADSLFLKPAGGSAAGLPLTLPTPAVVMSDGASAPRPSPDVSDILSLAAAVTTPLGLPGSRTTTAAAPFKLKEAETALRKRLEEQNEAQLRSLRIDYGKKEDAERQRLEAERARLKKELDAAWEREQGGGGGLNTGNNSNNNSSGSGSAVNASTATQRRLQTAREAKQIEESWKSRLHNVTTRLSALQQQVEAQQQVLQKSIYQSPEEVKKTLEARNAAEMGQLREATRKQHEVALQRLKSEHATQQAQAAAKAAETVAAAKKLAEATSAQKTEERKRQNATMLAALQAAVEAKQAELATTEKSGASPADSAAAKRQGLSEQDRAAIAAAQSAADAAVAEVERANALELSRLEEDYASKKREREAALQQQQQQQQHGQLRSPLSAVRSPLVLSSAQTPTRALSRATSNSSFTATAISPGEQAKLDDEERKLRDEADKAARVYEEETELMVANREAGRALTAAPPAAAAARVSAEAVAALSRTATQTQRARDAENARHSMAMKQLEAKHEQTVRLMKSQHDKALGGKAAASTTSPSAASSASPSAAAGGFNPRQHPSFTAQLNARRRSWTRDHPTPVLEMPTLTPIPTLPSATVGATMAAASMPDADEQAKIVKTRLVQTREELGHRLDRELQSLQRTKEKEVAAWQEAYRAERLAEVQAAVETLKKEKDAEVEKAKAAAAASSASTSAAAAAAAAKASADAVALEKEREGAKAEAAAAEKLSRAETDLRAAQAAVTTAEAERSARAAALTQEVAKLEEAVASLATRIHAEESRREELKTALSQAQRETEQLHQQASAAQKQQQQQQRPSTAPPSPQPSAEYIANAEAAEEEAALRARWTALLDTLRAAVQSEMANYERTLRECAAASTPTTASGAADKSMGAAATAPPTAASHTTANAHMMSALAEEAGQRAAAFARPPTAPLLSSYAAEAAVPLSAASQYSSALLAGGGFATPLQRGPPQSVSSHLDPYSTSGLDSSSVYPFNPRVGTAPHEHLQPQAYAQQAWLPPSAHSDVTMSRADRAGPGVEGVGRAAGLRHGDPNSSFLTGAFYDARHSAAVPLTYDDSRTRYPLYPSCSVSAAQRPAAATTAAAAPHTQGSAALQSSGDDHALRLAALQRAVRERRHELQAQRAELEQLRDEWRCDMQQCKANNDRAEARKLRHVKEVLEERARRLNAEVLEVKQMQHDVLEEVRSYEKLKHNRGSSSSGGGAGGGGDVVGYGADLYAGVSGDSGVSADVVELLQTLVRRTERLERLLRRSASRSDSDITPSPGARPSRRS